MRYDRLDQRYVSDPAVRYADKLETLKSDVNARNAFMEEINDLINRKNALGTLFGTGDYRRCLEESKNVRVWEWPGQVEPVQASCFNNIGAEGRSGKTDDGSVAGGFDALPSGMPAMDEDSYL
ncbi:MAG: hypothetical protein KJ645_10685 [Planctomycetes bacterium]|nr:hypothetical protein [Planctomycetota bacterium]